MLTVETGVFVLQLVFVPYRCTNLFLPTAGLSDQIDVSDQDKTLSFFFCDSASSYVQMTCGFFLCLFCSPMDDLVGGGGGQALTGVPSVTLGYCVMCVNDQSGCVCTRDQCPLIAQSAKYEEAECNMPMISELADATEMSLCTPTVTRGELELVQR